MGLKIWLPLLGNLNNIGCSNATITSYNNPVVNTDGKIGKCYQFSKANLQKLLITLDNPIHANNISFVCWVKLLQSATYGTIMTAGWDANKYFYAAINQGEWALGYGTTSYKRTKHITPIIGQWQQVALTVNSSNTATLYIDGNVVETATNANDFTLSSGFYIAGRESTSYYLNALMNDVRIYDHCLSKSEIHEIGLGLFAHYKLDDQFINISNHQWNTNVVVDSSGYERHGTIVGNVQQSIDTPKYLQSLYFDGQAGTYIRLPKEIKTSKDEITVMCWGKLGTQQMYLISITQSGGWTLFQSSNGIFTFETSHGSSHSSYLIAQGTHRNDLELGWHHFVGTYDGYQVKLYIDGELVGQSASLEQKEPIYYYSSNIPIIGAESGTVNQVATSPYNKGPISDVRLYSTALSIEDIKKIYQTNGKVDNKQRLHAFEFIEDTSLTRFSNNRKGQIKSPEIFESGEIVKIKSNGSVYADQIIEI